jgi:hypothetical protein
VIWLIGLRWISVPTQRMGVGFLVRFRFDCLVEEALTEWVFKGKYCGLSMILICPLFQLEMT